MNDLSFNITSISIERSECDSDVIVELVIKVDSLLVAKQVGQGLVSERYDHNYFISENEDYILYIAPHITVYVVKDDIDEDEGWWVKCYQS